jgi:hypothetical protein
MTLGEIGVMRSSLIEKGKREFSLFVAGLILCSAAIAGTASGAPEFVPFDGPGDFGFSQSVLDEIDPAQTREIDDWRLAADVNLRDPSILLLAHKRSLTRCTSAALGCGGSDPVYEVVWDIELNENYDNDDKPFGAPGQRYEMNLFLATWDRNPIFEDNLVSILYNSLSLDGAAKDFEVAHFVGRITGLHYSFLNIHLDDMIVGSDGIRELSFRYEVEDGLEGQGSEDLHVPFIGIGAFFAETMQTPEPSTGLLMSLALVAFGLNRSRPRRR